MVTTYLHCIIEGAEVSPFLTAAGNSRVYTLARDGLACVLSKGDGRSLSALPKEQLLWRLLAHQQVVERVMADHPVLPAKFGTVLASPEEATDLLAQGREQLLAALAAFRNKAEVEVAATWSIDWVLEEASKEQEVIRAREALSSQGPPTFADRLRLGQIVKASLDRRRQSFQERMLGVLRPHALDVAPHPLVSDNMVMNVAFLLEKSRQAQFDEAVRRLDRLFNNEIAFRVIGPLPPYSFGTVEIARVTPELVEAAQRRLGLGDVLSQAEVRRAYRHVAARLHRSLEMPDTQVQAELAQVRQAADLLLDCCRGRSDAAGYGPAFPQPAPSGRPALLITIKRPGAVEVDPSRFGGGPALPASA